MMYHGNSATEFACMMTLVAPNEAFLTLEEADAAIGEFHRALDSMVELSELGLVTMDNKDDPFMKMMHKRGAFIRAERLRLTILRVKQRKGLCSDPLSCLDRQPAAKEDAGTDSCSEGSPRWHADEDMHTIRMPLLFGQRREQ